jgi:hypothetical protein
MTAHDLLGALQARKVELWVEGGRLRWRGPTGALTGADLAALAEHKAALLALLVWDQAEADRLLAQIEARRLQLFGKTAWPQDDAQARALWPLFDAIDRAWTGQDMAGLLSAVRACLARLEKNTWPRGERP